MLGSPRLLGAKLYRRRPKDLLTAAVTGFPTCLQWPLSALHDSRISLFRFAAVMKASFLIACTISGEKSGKENSSKDGTPLFLGLETLSLFLEDDAGVIVETDSDAESDKFGLKSKVLPFSRHSWMCLYILTPVINWPSLGKMMAISSRLSSKNRDPSMSLSKSVNIIYSYA